MKAATYSSYGPPDVLKLADVARPTPKDNEVLVWVRASSVTSGDARMRGFRVSGLFWLPLRLWLGLFGPRYPIPGMEFSGRVMAAGAKVTRFKVGEPVFGLNLFGANAEYAVVPEDAVMAPKPDMLSDAEAAAVPFGALTALLFLRDLGQVKSGHHVAVYGASGNVGVFAVQLAKYFGATVTGVCSAANMALVKSLGADRVVDYASHDFTAGGETYDIIFDTVGRTRFAHCKRALKPHGRHLFLDGGLREIAQTLATALRRGKRVIFGVPSPAQEDLAVIKTLIEAGQITPVIDRTYPLHDIAEAHRYVDTGRKRGSVVIDVDGLAWPD